MKKIIALILAAATALSLGACKNGGEGNALPTSPNATGEPAKKEGVYIRDSYTVTDQQAQADRGKVVATMGDTELTNGVFHAFYWMAVYTFMDTYGSDAYYYGLNYSKPLDLLPMDEKGTWQHYFIEEALRVWHSHQSMALMAEKEGLSLNAERQTALDGLYDTMAASAEKGGYANVEEMIQKQMGAGCTYEDYYAYTRTIYMSYTYNDFVYDALDITMEDIQDYYDENEEALAEKDITKDAGDAYNVRHILVKITGGEIKDGKVEYTDADWAACKAKAQAILDEWLAGDQTEDSFAALAKERSEDSGAPQNGGLYEGLGEKSNVMEPFRDWYCAEGRKVGDYGLVKTDSGYHVMYLSAREPAWTYNIRNILVHNAISQCVNEAIEACPIETFYENISLGEVVLVADK